MSICPVCNKNPCACQLRPPKKFIMAREAATHRLATESSSNTGKENEKTTDAQNGFIDEMGKPFYPVEKIDIAVFGKTISAKTFDEAADILSGESGKAVVDITWKNDMFFKIDMSLDGDRTRVEPFLVKHLEEAAGLSTPEGMNVNEYAGKLNSQPPGAHVLAMGILGACDTGIKSQRYMEDPAFAIDLDTGGIVLSGERGIVNIKALQLVAANQSDEIIAMLKEHGLPAPEINLGILYGPFTPIEICKIKEVSGFASMMYKERYQSIPEIV